MTDRVISHYRLEHEIGRGGMGVVYRGTDTRLGRPVAIKVLPPDASAEPDRHRRFVREAQAASALNHPNIVTIYEIGEDAGTTFIAMELVEGTPLDRVLREGPLPVSTALDYATQAAAALEAAHARGIVHRDVKPANMVITADGRVKVLDFGLAKLVDRSAGDATITSAATLPGTILGTLAYMSPEQAEGRPVDARSDLFSLGAVVYEMLAGRRPFASDSEAGLVTAILRDDPAPIQTLRAEVPADVAAIVHRALAKEVGARPADAGVLRRDLTAAHARLTRPPEAAWRQPAVLLPVTAVLLLVVALGAWQLVKGRRSAWARDVAVPEIERLEKTVRSLDAVRLARDAERYAPAEVARARDTWLRLDITTDPAGAAVSVRNYLDVAGSWEPLGRTPLNSYPLPLSLYRLQIRKDGYEPLDIAYMPGRPAVTLTPAGAGEPGMVRVAGGRVSFGIAKPVSLRDFWVDRFEVTNREFKRFVDAGGYRDPRYWTAFQRNDREVAFADAMAEFRDPTGRPGPSTWELGSFPEGQDDFPVGGISWYEADAYARFAGKELLTLHHWYQASGVDEIFADMLRLSHFDAKGPVSVGTREAIGPWGAHDMAGNVKEWARNEAGDTDLRYILGGGWNESAYRFSEPEGRDPWERDPTFGVRLMKTTAPVPEAEGRISHISGDPESLVPVSDEQFALLRSFYAYDPVPLDTRVEAVDDGSPHWKKETVSFAGPSGGERIPAFVFTPRNVPPPYQAIVFFPSSYAREFPSSDDLDLFTFEFLVRSGRAVIYPVYQGTYERRTAVTGGASAVRDRNVTWAKEVFRAVDYLESRPDIDRERIGYYSLSLGAFFGPIPVALEPRFRAAVFAAGGLRFNVLPEIQPANFMPRVTIPVLLINGTNDFAVPPAARRRFLELLGTPPAHKKLVELEGGHVPVDTRQFFREALDWYDKYLGGR